MKSKLGNELESACLFELAIDAMYLRWFTLLCLLTLLGTSAEGRAASYYWDANGTDPGLGGTGTWDTTSPLWHKNADNGTLEVYQNADKADAFLLGTAGTVTLSGDIVEHDLTIGATLGSGTYTLLDGTLHMVDALTGTSQAFLLIKDTNAVIIKSEINLGMLDAVVHNLDLNVEDGTAVDDLIIDGQIISGGLLDGLYKRGLGKAVFTNTNTYSGETQVNEGVLQIDGVIDSAVTVNANLTPSGATLSGSGSVSKSIIIKSAGALMPGNKTDSGSGIGTFTLSGGAGANGNLSVESGGTLGLQLGANGINFNGVSYATSPIVSGANDRIVVSGDLSLTNSSIIDVSLLVGYTPTLGDAFDVLDWTGLPITNNGFTIGPGSNLRTGGADNGDYDLNLPDLNSPTSGYLWDVSLFASHGIIVVVPEPSTVMLFATGLISCLLKRCRNRFF